MQGDEFQSFTFRLHPGAVDCDAKGFRVAGHELLVASTSDGRASPSYVVPPLDELEKTLSRAYGWRISAAAKVNGVSVVATALNNGDVARAQIAALLLRLPDPNGPGGSDSMLAKSLQSNGWILRDWDPAKHPRTGTPPNPGWFAPTDGGDSAQAEPLRDSVSDKPPVTSPVPPVADRASGEQVAVLTTNFRYACRVLKLDPDEASDLLHVLKEGAGLGGADNCTFDTETGDVYFNGEHIGNLRP